MSGYGTHMLIGATGGLALVVVMERLHLAFTLLGGQGDGRTALLTHGSIIAASAYAALLPDIDEPRSF